MHYNLNILLLIFNHVKLTLYKIYIILITLIFS